MLAGGVITSMAMSYPAFTEFVSNKTGPNSAVYTSEDLQLANPRGVAMHAVFCYGWWDNPGNTDDGYWICKNRCGGVHRMLHQGVYLMSAVVSHNSSSSPLHVAR